MNVNTLTPNYPRFSDITARVTPAAKTIYFTGSDMAAVLALPTLTVVGTRRPTAYGQTITQQLIAALPAGKVTIVSGLALGIDATAHRAALATNLPTVAVLPSGIDTVYPRSHQGLAAQIVSQRGALVSEYANGTTAYRHHFIARNRLMAALGDAILVTEATQHSGTLHTVRFALDMGKTVLAVPGNISSAASVGTNSLIKAGATVVTGPDDILLALGLEYCHDDDLPATVADPEERTILELVRQGISEGGELLSRSGLPAENFNRALTMLELSGHIRPSGADNWLVI